MGRQPNAKLGLLIVPGSAEPLLPKTSAMAEAWSKKRHFYKPLPKEFRKNGIQLPTGHARRLRDEESAFRKLREIVVSLNAPARFEQKEVDRIEKSPT